MEQHLAKSDEELLAECDVETYRASGPGGQNVNRRETAVRLRHRPTGIVVTCQRERSQWMNKMLAVEELRRRIARLLKRRRPRIKTKVPRGARERVLEKKRFQSQKKGMRRPPGAEE